MNGDIDAYHDPMGMLHEATQYLDRVRQTLVEANHFEDILQVRSAGELYLCGQKTQTSSFFFSYGISQP